MGADVDDELPRAALADVSPHEVLLDRMQGELTPHEEAAGPADFASAVQCGTREREFAANGLPTAKVEPAFVAAVAGSRLPGRTERKLRHPATLL